MRRRGRLGIHHVVAALFLAVGAVLVLTGCGGGAATTTIQPSTIQPSTTGGGSGGTAVTVPSTRQLTFVGPLSQATLRRIRDIVAAAADDGQKVLDEVAALSAGAPVPVSDMELDAARGVGYSAGATSSQPVAVADVPDGGQVFLVAFTVSGRPEQTTIAAFELGSGRFVTRDGPLPIAADTPNITTTTL